MLVISLNPLTGVLKMYPKISRKSIQHSFHRLENMVTLELQQAFQEQEHLGQDDDNQDHEANCLTSAKFKFTRNMSDFKVLTKDEIVRVIEKKINED